MNLQILVMFAAVLALGCIAPQQSIGPVFANDTYTPSIGQQFGAHFVNSAPAHGDVYATVPAKVIINTNFVLREPSEVKISHSGADVSAGVTRIADDELSMERDITANGDGEYIVSYKGCWPDRSCHDGRFAFYVDSGMLDEFVDMTGQAEITVDMEDIAFDQQLLKVSRGTKITWVNKDSVEHFVNSDPHPSHNFIPGLNSLQLDPGESFSYTFSETGEYHYHCSLHVPQGMTAIVLVI